MEYFVGLSLALVLCAAVAARDTDRERVFDPSVATTVASCCLASAVVGRSPQVMVSQALIAAVLMALLMPARALRDPAQRSFSLR